MAANYSSRSLIRGFLIWKERGHLTKRKKSHAKSPPNSRSWLTTAFSTHSALAPRARGLNLVVAAIVLWNTAYLERVVQALRDAGNPGDTGRGTGPHWSGWPLNQGRGVNPGDTRSLLRHLEAGVVRSTKAGA